MYIYICIYMYIYIFEGLMGTVRLAKWKEKRTYLALKCIKKTYIIKHKDERHINFERFPLSLYVCINIFGIHI
jgi:hypothetical protein